jgi:hypothetical protein
MKLLLDKQNKTNTIILEKFKLTSEQAGVLYNFCNTALNVPEVIGGIYYRDMQSQDHLIELNNQMLFTLVYTLKSMSLRLPLGIVYDTDLVPIQMLEVILKKPTWVIQLLQFLGLLPRFLQFGHMEFNHAPKPSTPVSDPIHQSP